jgi:hypothetical protein
VSQHYKCIGSLYGDIVGLAGQLADLSRHTVSVWVDDLNDVYPCVPAGAVVPPTWIIGTYLPGTRAAEFERDLRAALRERSHQDDVAWKAAMDGSEQSE